MCAYYYKHRYLRIKLILIVSGDVDDIILIPIFQLSQCETEKVVRELEQVTQVAHDRARLWMVWPLNLCIKFVICKTKCWGKKMLENDLGAYCHVSGLRYWGTRLPWLQRLSLCEPLVLLSLRARHLFGSNLSLFKERNPYSQLQR